MEQLKREKVLEVFCTLALACVVIALLTSRVWVFYVAAAILCVGLFIKPLAAIIATLWMTLAQKLGLITTPIILSIVFFAMLTPIAVLYRLFHKNPLQLKKENTDQPNKTYFTDRTHCYTPADLENPW